MDYKKGNEEINTKAKDDIKLILVTQLHSWFKTEVLGIELTEDRHIINRLFTCKVDDASKAIDTLTHIVPYNKVNCVSHYVKADLTTEKSEITEDSLWLEVTNPVEWINSLYSLTGLGYDNALVKAPGESTKQGESSIALQLWRIIYQTPLPVDVRILQVDVCGCNMGHCYQPIDITMLSIKLFGELFTKLGDEKSDSIGGIWFEYPDSVFLYVKQLMKFPVCQRDSCYGLPITSELVFDPSLRYISVSYGR